MKLILIGTLGSTIWKAVNTGIQFLLLWIDSVIYWFASQCYQLFIKLAATRIFEDNFFANFANRIYVVLGVFMLFYLAYALLTAIVDPEKLSKGDKGVSKIASNLVISLVILGFLPTIFSYAYRLQNYVLASNLIGSLVLGTPMTGLDEDDENKDAMLQYGDVLSFTVLNTFLNPDNVNFTITQRANTNADYNWYDLKADILENGDYSAMPMMNEAVANKATLINATGGSGTEARIDYKPVISTAAGVFLVYVLLTFTIDLGIRVVKFAFLQLIAPIPVIMRVIPGKKGTFDKWLKQTLSVYFEVFVRVAIMYLAIYFINAIANSASLDQFFGSESGIQGKLAFAIIIMGILAFAKQAPKMISDLLGIDTGGLKLGIGDKLKAGGFFAGGAMVGAGATGLVRGVTNGFGNTWRNVSKASGAGKLSALAGGLVGGIGSTISDTTAGVYNAYKSGKGAKNFSDMKKAAESGAKAGLENRGKRESYIAAHGGPLGAVAGRISDVGNKIGEFAGVSLGLDALKNIQSKANEVKSARKAIDDRAEAILNKNKNVFKANKEYSIPGVEGLESFKNYADLLNEMEIMKSTGKTHKGQSVTPTMLTQMAQLEHDMKEDMKKDIISGYDLKNGGKYDAEGLKKDYDSELRELITSYRTKSLQNASAIMDNASSIYSDSIKRFKESAIDSQNLSLEDFILNTNSNDSNKTYIESLFSSSNDAIKSANSELSTRVAQRIESEAKKQGK